MNTPAQAPKNTVSPLKNLVLCADDFALSASVSQAIVQLARNQRLKATSAMVLSPRWAEDGAQLRELRAHMDVGLHLDWTSNFARAQGHGQSLAHIMWRSVWPQALGGLPWQAAVDEVERQLDAFEAVWQAPPDHIDGHQHIQQFGTLRRALLHVMQRRYAEHPPYLRVSRPPPGQADFKGRVIAAWGSEALTREAAQQGVPCAPALSGIYDLYNRQADYAQLMDSWLTQVPETTLLMCHPGLSAQTDDHAYARVAEWQHLASPLFGQQLAERGVRLVRGTDLYR